jgi:1,4-dihydroxy-6-naphthoate synthase
MARTITLAHSPDSDDAFMFYALAKGKVDTRGLTFKHVLDDIETLNKKAIEGTYEVTAVSFHAYYKIRDRYRLMTAGASVGDGYGPMIVSKRPLSRQDLDEVTVAVPGTLTTAFLVFRLFAPGARLEGDAVRQDPGRRRGGPHRRGPPDPRGQLTYREQKLHRVQDLGEWWKMETGLPLPLGGNALRRDLDRDTAQEVLRRAARHGASTRSTTARRRSTTPSSTPAGWTARRRTSSSGCTSTPSRWSWASAPRTRWRCSSSSAARPGSSR